MFKRLPVIFFSLLMIAVSGYSQARLKLIPLPKGISGVNEEFSGMTLWGNRVYLEPQYGDYKETKLNGKFNIYSINADSIGRVIDGKDTGLSRYRTIRVIGLNQLPDSVKQYYEGFEAISIINKQVFLSIETNDTYNYCFLLKGTLDTLKNEIHINPHFVALRRYPHISNAGFESVTYMPTENKLLAYYEFNGMADGGTGYLIDTAFKQPPQKIKVPFLYFRLTDITATAKGQIYGINYYWNGDYDNYLNNKILTHQEDHIKQIIPDLRDSLNNNPNYLKGKTFARIVTLKNYKATQWKQAGAAFEGFKNKWEGLTLFRKGALIITDAKRSTKQVTALGYLGF